MSEQKLVEAVELLQPFVAEKGIAGREARQLSGRINVRRYLSRMHPHAAVYKVRPGDTMGKVAAGAKCPVDVIMLLNGVVEPSDLKVGQKLVVAHMGLRLEIHLSQREISVWDEDKLVASYNIEKVEGAVGTANEESSVVERAGFMENTQLPRHSLLMLSSDRMLRFSNGVCLASGQHVQGARFMVRMNQRDLNELALLVMEGCRADFVYDDGTFAQPLSPNNTEVLPASH